MSLDTSDTFQTRHVGPRERDLPAMLETVGVSSLDQLVSDTVPASIRLDRPLALPAGESEHRYLTRLRSIAAENRVLRSFIGLGYYDTITPAVILRNVMENPGWYTPYTPYQAEIAQGRLESLLNFQTMVSDLTGMAVANASLLDEANGGRRGNDAAAPGAHEEDGTDLPRIRPRISSDDRGAAVARRAARV